MAELPLRAGHVSAGAHGHRLDHGVGMATDPRRRAEDARGRRDAAAATGDVRGIHDPLVCCGLRHWETRAARQGPGANQRRAYSLQESAGERG